MRNLMLLIQSMRKAQNDYFNGAKSQTALKIAKSLEAKLDGQVLSYFKSNPELQDDALTAKTLELWLDAK